MNTHTVASVAETLGFIVAVILQVLGHHPDALVSALVGATCHAYNH